MEACSGMGGGDEAAGRVFAKLLYRLLVVNGRIERFELFDQLVHKIGSCGVNRTGNIVDGFVRVQLGALTTRTIHRFDNFTAYTQ